MTWIVSNKERKGENEVKSKIRKNMIEIYKDE
jgi:hypothetical protein